jgi:hypothetical protein
MPFEYTLAALCFLGAVAIVIALGMISDTLDN